jgi:hypothetical protein
VGWQPPAIASARGTSIGAIGYEFFYGPLPPGEYWASHGHFEDHFDAVLYLGPVSADTVAPLTFPRCGEANYVAMRVRRMELSGVRPPPGTPSISERIAQDCHP